MQKLSAGINLTGQTIPVQIDHIIETSIYAKTRCTFFRVESPVEPLTSFETNRYIGDLKLAVWGSWAALTGPGESINSSGVFDSADTISRTLDGIEENDRLYLDIGYFWLPHALLRTANQDHEPVNGDVYRVSMKLFLTAYSQARSEDPFDSRDDLEGIDPSDVMFCREETSSFRQWREIQIDISRRRFRSNDYEGRRMENKNQ